MLHFALQSGGVGPIQDNQGQSGVAILSQFLFDGTPGGEGDTEFMSLYVFNDDTNYEYLTPQISIAGSDPIIQNSFFTLLDDMYVSGLTPTPQEFQTYGVPGTGVLQLQDIDVATGQNPQRQFWVQLAVPAGIAAANFTDLSLQVTAVQEAV